MKTEETQVCEIDSNMLENYLKYSYPKDFDCGLEGMNKYFKENLKRALKSKNVSAIGAIAPNGDVAGFITLTFTDIEKKKVDHVITDSNLLPNIAVMRIVMFGVDSKFQGLGIGQELLKKAFQQAALVHKQVPLKGIYLDAAPRAVSLYESIGFEALGEPDQDGSTPMIVGINVVVQSVESVTEQ
ncbi:GNAT family N-acetyltransferase [Pseudomonas paraveronii]|uniref:GNAT family N-acetyltransferase n=1 Tax=Pseudomonas paraveronii TaxID=3040598 RepID=UPI002AB2D6CA|nr:GNAT family N-acetyltransferase [Pseudomonas sp. V3/K/3/5]